MKIITEIKPPLMEDKDVKEEETNDERSQDFKSHRPNTIPKFPVSNDGLKLNKFFMHFRLTTTYFNFINSQVPNKPVGGKSTIKLVKNT